MKQEIVDSTGKVLRKGEEEKGGNGEAKEAPKVIPAIKIDILPDGSIGVGFDQTINKTILRGLLQEADSIICMQFARMALEARKQQGEVNKFNMKSGLNKLFSKKKH